jgi:predicted GNAT family acetyltransferase
VRGARVTGAAEFRERAGPLLEADELRHTVPLGVLSTLERDPGRYAEHHLWLVEDAGAVVACAMMTPPFHLLVAGRDGAALDELVATVGRDGPDVPGVNGPVPEADEFAARWASATGTATRIARSMRMYATAAVTPAPATVGAIRTAGESDRALLAEWAHAFARETGLQEGPAEIARSIDARVGADPGIVVWDVGGEPVTMAGASVSSPGIARVGPVYTPPERRRRGYATALVAAWTAHLLSRGIRRCALFTDLANPTSNSIYQAVGYRPVTDAVEIDFI